MEVEKILVIDDEMYPEGSKEPRYGRLSEADLAVQIKSFMESQEFEVEFSEKGEDAIERIEKDIEKEIKLVLLDIRFTKVDTRMQGPTIFRKIREIRGDLPIVIITILPTRKLPQREDIFKELVELGASLFIEKKYFTKRGKEQLNFINALIRKQEIKYTLRYSEGLDSDKMEIIDIDILRKEKDTEFSILKNPYRIPFPMEDYIEQCVEEFPNPVHWKENLAVREEWTDTKFHKEVHKLNDRIMRSSGGRIPDLLERLGRAGCRLNIDKIEKR
ncbi:response regulator [candidate division WOR-3 bacterium]|nr:response regulator [candidate division WOR-3 bacterium]